MLYYVIRIFFVVLVAITCGIIIHVVSKKFKIEKKSITFRIMSIICGCLLIFTYCFPYEGVVIKFNTVDKIFRYYFPKCKVIKKYETDDYAYILFLDKDNAERFIYYVNSKNGWRYDDDFKRGQGVFKSAFPYTIIVNRIKGKDVTAIFIGYDNLVIDRKVSIKDSLSSKFDFFVKEDNDDDFKFYTYITVIDRKIDDNYTLTIDGKEYKPLQMPNQSFYMFE